MQEGEVPAERGNWMDTKTQSGSRIEKEISCLLLMHDAAAESGPKQQSQPRKRHRQRRSFRIQKGVPVLKARGEKIFPVCGSRLQEIIDLKLDTAICCRLARATQRTKKKANLTPAFLSASLCPVVTLTEPRVTKDAAWQIQVPTAFWVAISQAKFRSRSYDLT